MQINFDLEEFIAYLLNGGLLLSAIFLLCNFFKIDIPLDDLTTLSGRFPILQMVVVTAIILLCGHVSSVFSRRVTRLLIWHFFKSPRDAPFVIEEPPQSSDFWNQALVEDIRVKVATIRSFESDADRLRIAPRLIRSYTLERSERLRERRNRIVQARSVCANAVLPLLLFVLYLALSNAWIMALVCIVIMSVLLCKQHDLDRREWKEVYFSFLVLPDPKARETEKPESRISETG